MKLLSIFLSLMRVISIVIMSLRTLGSGPFRVTTRLYEWLFWNPQFGDTGKRIPCWMSKHPVFCSFSKPLDDDHQYPADPFGALADFKTIFEKEKMQTVRGLTQDT